MKTINESKNEFIHGEIFSTMVKFAVPMFFSNIFQQLYNAVDTIIIGRTLGEKSLAAMGSASVLYDLLVGFALGVGNGLSIVAARCYGSGDKIRLKKMVSAAIMIGIVLSLCIAVITRFSLYPLLELLQTPQSALDEAYEYISAITLFIGVLFAYNLCAGILRATGNSIVPLFFLIIASITNICLDLVFIIPLNMGIRGAAYATITAQGISAILCFIYILKRFPELLPNCKYFICEKEIYKEMIQQGISFGLMESVYCTGSVFLQTSINALGYLTAAGHTAARKLFLFFLMPFSAMISACNMMISQNHGSNRPERIRKTLFCTYKYVLCTSLFVSAVLIPFAPKLIAFISGSEEIIVLKNGTMYLRFVAPFYFILGILNTSRGALQALGKKILPILSSMIELLGKIIFALLFVPYFQYNAVIVCEPIIWCFMVAELLWALWKDPYLYKNKQEVN